MSKCGFSVLNNTKNSLLSQTISVVAKETDSFERAAPVLPPELLRQTVEPYLGEGELRRSASFRGSARRGGQRMERPDQISSRSPNLLKRSVDVIVASTLFVLLLPFLLLIAMLVRLSGPGPLIFRQERIGEHGKPFMLLKFRTMRDSAEFIQATIDDPRVTAIGRILRRLSFDELVQLVNVIKGEMSLVGPRPHSPKTRVEGILFEEAVQSYQQRYAARPGITGLAQIRGQRGQTLTIRDLEERVASDIEYIENWSIWLDLNILLQTIPAILKQVNAY